MSYITTTMDNLIHQTAFFNMTWGNVVMILVACVFLYLAIAKEFEPLLLVPIAFGMLLVNIYPDIMLSFEDSSNGVGGLLYYFYKLDEWAILPSLIFMGVGAMTDFGPLIANPKSFLLGAAAQFGIFAAYFGAIAMGFNDKAAAAISIIGGADGPTSIFLCGKLGQTQLLGPIAVAAYSYMSLVPIIQPPDHEASDHRKRAEDQNGTAPSGYKAGAYPVPDHRYNRCLPDPAYHSSAGWYADVRKPVQRKRCGSSAGRYRIQRPDVHRCNSARYFRWRNDKCRSILKLGYHQDRCAGSDCIRIRYRCRRSVR